MKIKLKKPIVKITITEGEAQVLFHALNEFNSRAKPEPVQKCHDKLFKLFDKSLKDGNWKFDTKDAVLD